MSDSRIDHARADITAAKTAPPAKAAALINDAACLLAELHEETWNDALGAARSSLNVALAHVKDGQPGAASISLTIALTQLGIFELQIAPVF